MSLPWKSDLRLSLTREGCHAQRLAPWSRRVLAEARASGSPQEALTAVLRRLRETAQLPASARLTVSDEQAYLALRTSARRWTVARREATRHFARAIGRTDLVVQVAGFGHSSTWIAAAVEAADLDAWRGALAAEGVRLRSLGLALLDDLRDIAPRIGERAVVALLRREGVSLVRIDAGVPVELAWERCDPDSMRCIEQRVLAFAKASGDAVAWPVWMLCREEWQLEPWSPVARAHQWTVIARPQPPLADAAPVEAVA